jgi:heme-degrading monooxygenase HmoA
MITRVFRVRVPKALHKEFEKQFINLSIPTVKAYTGLITVTVGRPTRWAPEEYVMISLWDNEQSVKDFAGEQWNQAVIPEGMEKYVAECWVHHYESFGYP